MTPSYPNTKIATYLNKRNKIHTARMNKHGTVAYIRLAMTTLVGEYLPGGDPIENLIDDIPNICTPQR